jgi:23S rRNA (guanosine2251-2'-O)-methyltransferase
MSIAYGIHAVLEALRADPSRIERICVQRGLTNPRLQELIDACRVQHVLLAFEPKAWLDRKSGGGKHQGALCYLAEMSTLGVEDILSGARTPGLLVILDGIEDTQNVGAILRSAEVAGADGVFLPQRRSAPLSPAAIKASAGAAAHLKVSRTQNIVQLMEQLKSHSYWITGLDAEARISLWDVDLTIPSVLVFGSEGHGLRSLVRQKCDFLASIPVRGKIASYNVSVAAGIALYEAVRQRGQKMKL